MVALGPGFPDSVPSVVGGGGGVVGGVTVVFRTCSVAVRSVVLRTCRVVFRTCAIVTVDYRHFDIVTVG